MNTTSFLSFCPPEGEGGLGFKDFASFNIALLANQFWRLINNPNALWAKVLKGLYFPNSSPLEAPRGSTPSWIWCSLLEGKDLLHKGIRWNVGNGDSIKFWEDEWVPGLTGAKINSLPPEQCDWIKVADFIDQSNQSWDVEKLRNCVSEEETRAILKIPISISKCPDKLIWHSNSSGKYSVKSGYHKAFKKILDLASNQPSSSYTPSKSMWTRLWAIPTAPKVRHFMWKVVHNWLASKENLFRRKCAHSPLCPICGSENESIEHLLFRCPWTRAVWFGSNMAFWVLDK